MKEAGNGEWSTCPAFKEHGAVLDAIRNRTDRMEDHLGHLEAIRGHIYHASKTLTQIHEEMQASRLKNFYLVLIIVVAAALILVLEAANKNASNLAISKDGIAITQANAAEKAPKQDIKKTP